ncbi:hypothetical protein BDF19DRAFT_449235 [Syncephalis fuscata]|nr:hypothetical protein BDF19DRAFT_449235 [Syncephalis fuscata]
MYDMEDTHTPSCILYKTATIAQGLSGRVLRKLPFLACANQLKIATSISIEMFLNELKQAVEREQNDSAKLNKN